jgi:hypothetical protein
MDVVLQKKDVFNFFTRLCFFIVFFFLHVFYCIFYDSRLSLREAIKHKEQIQSKSKAFFMQKVFSKSLC